MLAKKRNDYIDIVRGFAIFIMILGHSIQFGFGPEYLSSKEYFSNFIFKFIYGFHMPLFALISGYLFYKSVSKKTNKEILSNIVHRFLIPILLWSIIPIFLYIKNLESFDMINIFLSSIQIVLNNLWFLWAIVIFQLLILLGSRKFKDHILFYILIFVIMFFITDDYNFQLYKFIYPFFVLGYISNKFNLKRLEHIFCNNIVMVLSLILYILLIVFYTSEVFVYNSGISLLNSNCLWHLYIDFYRWVVAFIGCSFILIFLLKFKNIKTNLFKYLGKNSMGIYIVNTIICNCFIFKVTNIFSHNIIFVVLMFILLMSLSIVADIIIKKSPLFKCLLFGNK